MKEKRNRILIADADRALHQKIKSGKSSSYQFESAYTGFSCWEKIELFDPDLIIIDLMLPQIHGMEILRKIKSSPRTQHIGVILASTCPSTQNYHSALMNHVDYFLEKPFALTQLSSLIHRYFKGDLSPDPFAGISSQVLEGSHCYVPKKHVTSTYLKFWGTRGSNPVSGADYIRFGGNTACLEVRDGNDLVIFDAGTGIRPFGNQLNEKPPKDIHLVLSHFHFDHLSGFPFFAPIYNPDCHIHIWTPIGFEKTAREIFTEMLTYAFFPVRLEDIQATLTFKDIHEGVPFRIGNIEINSHYAFHPGATLCFKINCHNNVFGYATDNELFMGYHGNPNTLSLKHPLTRPFHSLIEFFEDCDFLIHEAQYAPAEYQSKVGWGHSSICNAAVLMKLAKITDWIITHHDPKHTDMDLLKKIQLQYDILDDMKLDCRVRMAFDFLTVPLINTQKR